MGEIYYIAANGSDSNSGLSESAPRLTVPARLINGGSGSTVAAAVTCLFRRGDGFRIADAGNHISLAGGIGPHQRMVLGAYGQDSAPRPVLDFDTLAQGVFCQARSRHWTLQDLKLAGVTASTSQTSALVYIGGISAWTFDGEIRRCEITDNPDSGASQEANGIWGYANRLLLDSCEISHVGSDAVWLAGRHITVINCNIHDISEDTVLGDCLQIAGSDITILNNTLDHSNKECKHCIIAGDNGAIDPTATRVLVAFNTMTMGTGNESGTNDVKVCNATGRGAIVIGNRISGGRYGIWGADLAAGNLVTGYKRMGYQGASYVRFYNNTVIGDAAVEGGFKTANGADGCDVLNNIFMGNTGAGAGQAAQYFGTSTRARALGNISYNNSNNQIYIRVNQTAGNFQNVNPLLDSNHRPQAGSPALRAGADLDEWAWRQVRDLLGRHYDIERPTIGAFQF